VDAVLEGGAEFGERHAGAVELAFVAEFARRQPDGGEAVQMEEPSETSGIQLIGLAEGTRHGC
jgi:hypothetical protein